MGGQCSLGRIKKKVFLQGTVDHKDARKYRQLLVRSLHASCIKFPAVPNTVIPFLMEFLSENNELAVEDVLIFVREVMSRFDNLRPVIIEKLLEALSGIRTVKVSLKKKK